MSYGQLYGRRVRVTIGRTVVVDLDYRDGVRANDARNLHCSFSCATHAKPEPLVADVEVRNLSRSFRAKFAAQQDEARRQAWQKYQAVVVGDVLVEPDQVDEAAANLVTQGAQVTIEAGYQDDFGIIHVGTVLPDGFSDPPSLPGSVTTFRSQDNRLPWSNAFVSEEVAPGVTLVDYQQALAVAEGYLRGDVGAAEVEAQAPGLLERKLDVFGYQNGKVLHGQTRDKSQELMDTLGLRPFIVNGQPYFLPVDAVRFTEAVALQLVPRERPETPTPGGLLSIQKVGRFYQGRCLLNHKMSAGRQVRVRNEDGSPYEGGLFRVEKATHSGSTFEQPFYTDFFLRPTSVPAIENR